MKFKISAETPCIKGMQHLFYFNNCQRRDYTSFLLLFHQCTGATLGIVGNGSTSFATKEKNIAKYSVATEVYNIFMQGMDDYEKQMEQNKKNKWGMK